MERSTAFSPLTPTLSRWREREKKIATWGIPSPARGRGRDPPRKRWEGVGNERNPPRKRWEGEGSERGPPQGDGRVRALRKILCLVCGSRYLPFSTPDGTTSDTKT